MAIARSTVYAVLRRAGLYRPVWLHRTTREVVRYEHPRSGAPVHLGIKATRVYPKGVAASASQPGSQRLSVALASDFDFVHVAVDDHSYYAYAETLPDERGATAAAFLLRALAHFERQGITIECVLTESIACYVSRIFTSTAAAKGFRVSTRDPCRPQTNGMAEAFNKIIQAE